MTVVIAVLYAAFLVEAFAAGVLGARALSPAEPVARGVRYSGALTRHMAHDRYIRDTAHARNV